MPLMNFYDEKSKRTRALVRFTLYGISAFMIVILTVILVLVSQGYWIDRTSGQVIRNGLVFVDSLPHGATIQIDGKAQRDLTAARYTLLEGTHTLSLQKPGYRIWTKQFSLTGSQVVDVTYPRLVPLQLSPKNGTQYSASPIMSLSQDRRWLLISQNTTASTMVFDLYDTNREPLAATQFSFLVSNGAIPVVKSIQWLSDNDHVLVRAVRGGVDEFFVTSRSNPAVVSSINQIFGIVPTSLVPGDNKGDIWYSLEASGAVRRLSLVDKILPTPIASRVSAITGDLEQLFMTQTDSVDTTKRSVLLRRRDNQFTLISPTTSTPLCESGQYTGTRLAVCGVDGRVRIYRNAEAVSEPHYDLENAEAESIVFGPTDRFVAVKSKSSILVVDFEDDKIARKELADTTGRQVSWFDMFHILYTATDDQLHLIDYDGNNDVPLGIVARNGLYAGDRREERIISLSPIVDGSILQTTSLTE